MVKRTPGLDAVFSALSDSTRRNILRGLMEGRAPVGRLAQPFAVSAPAISRHLRVLERTGLIRRVRRGRTHQIELVTEPLRAATDWLESYRRFWEANLDSLADYLEQTPDPSLSPKLNPKPKTQPKQK